MWQAHNLFALSTPPWVDALHAGVDEVGIGPLAGPVLAAAVLLDTNHNIDALKDSKVLTAKRRENLAETIKSRSLCWAIGRAEVDEIDRLNILQASHLAMQRAVRQLPLAPDLVYVDGNKTPKLRMPVVAVVQGDRRVPQISAASIIAKVARDAEMLALDQQYPGYGFARHKGYPTRAHFQALQELGACAIHRRSFAPVARVL